MQEPLRIIIDTDNDGEGRTSRAILNVEPVDLTEEAGSESGLRLLWWGEEEEDDE